MLDNGAGGNYSSSNGLSADARQGRQHSSSLSVVSHGTPESQSGGSGMLDAKQLRVLSKENLITLLCRKAIEFDDADLEVLRVATLQRLKTLRARAREGKMVDEASEFVRWLSSSGVLK